jgi:hypothetical protein
MTFRFDNLDEKTRNYMLEELKLDIENHTLFISPRLNPHGVERYPQILSDEIKDGNGGRLAIKLNEGCLNETEQRRNPKGGFTTAKVPSNAHEMIAEGEFNRFYVRALCRRAIDENLRLVVYRAKSVSNPRTESEMKIGQTVDPYKLLQDLRENPGVDTALGVPNGPNSGLSVRIAG